MKNPVVEQRPDRTCCPEMPELRRLQYFYGQMLGSQDLRDEQSYFREKIKLLNRCLHGYGIVCGLEVRPVTVREPCEPKGDVKLRTLRSQIRYVEDHIAARKQEVSATTDPQAKTTMLQRIRELEGDLERHHREMERLCAPVQQHPPGPAVVVDCGVAVDCEGNDIVVRRPYAIDLLTMLTPAERAAVECGDTTTLYLRLCYCELAVEPVRPVHSDHCAPSPGCRHAKIQDSFRFEVTTDPPPVDDRCEPCCCACAEPCLVVARIDGVRPGHPVCPEDIHSEVRRTFARYDWVTIAGIGWVHGARYTDEQVARILGRDQKTDGLEFRFSRSIRSETVVDGVIDVWVLEGGRGRSGGIYNVPGCLTMPSGPLVDRVWFRQTSDDRFHDGDRVLLTLRTDFILDQCCRPVDGNHVGGRVPLIPDCAEGHPKSDLTGCPTPPDGMGPWTSGNGRGGGTFESWIKIVA